MKLIFTNNFAHCDAILPTFRDDTVPMAKGFTFMHKLVYWIWAERVHTSTPSDVLIVRKLHLHFLLNKRPNFRSVFALLRLANAALVSRKSHGVSSACSRTFRSPLNGLIKFSNCGTMEWQTGWPERIILLSFYLY